ncbi:TPA: helix-turn-helix domain-containing protein [Morganella morganii]|uniref:helix-turn-helix domain-containing protein n=1 Tax=Morganella morganii TaxID=582 RepID=UPI002699559F
MLLLELKHSSFEGLYRVIFSTLHLIMGYNNIHFLFYLVIMDITVSIWSLRMKFTLLDDTDVSQAYAAYLRELRKQAKLSRAALAERSCVPAATIKKFELTGQISFRQLLLLWQTLDSLDRLYELTQPSKERAAIPTSIDEVLKDEF